LKIDKKLKILLTFIVMVGIGISLNGFKLKEGEEGGFQRLQLTKSIREKSKGTDAAFDAAGNIMVVWAEDYGDNANKLYYKLYDRDNNKWTDAKMLPDQVGNNVYVRIAGGEEDEFFIVWSRGVEPSQKIYFSRYHKGVWSKPMLVSQAAKHNEFGHISYDKHGKRAAAVWANWPGGMNLETYLRIYQNGQWGSFVNISHSDKPTGHPAVTFDGKGNIYVAYMQMTSREPEEWQIAYNTNRSGRWLSTGIIITSTPGWKFHPSIAASNDGKHIMITWYDFRFKKYYYQHIDYSYSIPKWSKIEPIDGGHRVHALYYNSVCYVSDRFYFFYISADLNVYVKEFINNQWSTRTQLSESNDNIYSLGNGSDYFGGVVSWIDRSLDRGQIFVAWGTANGEPPEPPNIPPVAKFTYTPKKGLYPLKVNFDASSSYDEDGKIVEYKWNFEDGTFSKGVKVSHTYSKKGKYHIKLTVTDDDGDTGMAYGEVEVLGIYSPLNQRYQLIENRSLFVTEYLYKIEWDKNPKNSEIGAFITNYKIYRREKGLSSYKFLKIVPANNFKYYDRSLGTTKKNYEYYITAVDDKGRESDIAETNSLEITFTNTKINKHNRKK